MKPLAGRTLWMLEPTFVPRERRSDLKENPEGGRLRVGGCSLMRLYSGPNGSSMPVFVEEAHYRVGVQLHQRLVGGVAGRMLVGADEISAIVDAHFCFLARCDRTARRVTRGAV